ncbi:hypothetical protein M0802_016458 [Mischocyttarus mexicanus]|nr:hypothetical protein M0802_016458 [Mischocyttarus mexicanus]
MERIKIGSWNGGRERLQIDAIRKRCKEMGIQILMVQEPYINKRECTLNFGEGRCYVAGNDSAKSSAIIVIDKAISAMLNNDEYDEACVSIEAVWNGGGMTIVSFYCRPKGDIRTQMAKLERIVRKKHGRRVICGADLNSRSVLWNSGQTDRRGFIVEETLEVLDMEVLNTKNKDNITTFEDTRGRGSNIDVIFITENLRKEMGNWQLDNELISDHRMLITEWKREIIVGSGTNNDKMRRVGGYNLRKMNKQMFEKFTEELEKQLVDNGDKELDEMVEVLQKGIEKVSDMSGGKAGWMVDEGNSRMETKYEKETEKMAKNKRRKQQNTICGCKDKILCWNKR